MSLQKIVEGVYQVPLGVVNAYLLDQSELCLVDTGIPGTEEQVLAAIRELGREPDDVQHILVTHLHADHTGGLEELKRVTGAPAYMHPIDAEAVRQGVSARESHAAPGVIPWLITNVFMRIGDRPGINPIPIEYDLEDGQVLSFAGDLQVVHVPGHAAGQVAFLLPQAGVLLAADAAANMIGLGYPPIFEDTEMGKRSLRKLAELQFDFAGFGHGSPIFGRAAEKFRRKFGRP